MLSLIISIDEDKDCLSFWHEKKEIYPLFSSLLSTPASMAPVERIFLKGGDGTTKKRNSLGLLILT